MIKNFSGWHTLKQNVDNAARLQTSVGYKERDIWWVSLGHNVGFEEDGKGQLFSRPVLIVKGFSSEVFWGVPLTTRIKSGKYYYQITNPHTNSMNTLLLSQMRIFDTKRMTTKIGMISNHEFSEVKKQLRSFLK